MSLVRETNEKTFNDIYSDADTFYKESNEYGFNQSIDEDATKTIFYLLTSYYGDCTTMGYRNETRWKMKLFSIVWQYAPEWVRKINLADSIRNTTDSEAKEGSKAITNQSANPQNAPTSDELPYINNQAVTKYGKSKLEALELLYDTQKSNHTKVFLERFKVLFNPVLLPSDPLYVYEGE